MAENSIQSFILKAKEYRASDLLISVGKPPMIRRDAKRISLDLPQVDESTITSLIKEIVFEPHNKLLDENGEEVEIRENVEPPTNNYRFEMEGETRNYDYERDDMASYGYQKQEFNEDGELTDAYDESEMDDYADEFVSDVDFDEAFDDEN